MWGENYLEKFSYRKYRSSVKILQEKGVLIIIIADMSGAGELSNFYFQNFLGNMYEFKIIYSDKLSNVSQKTVTLYIYQCILFIQK